MENAVCTGDLKSLQEHIRGGADVNQPCNEEGVGGSLLILAIREGYQDISLALLEAGADVHTEDRGGWTALHWACRKGLEEVVQALIERGSQVSERDEFRDTPMMLAEWWGGTAISMCLLRAGASCEGLPEWQVSHLFPHACGERDLAAVHTLLKNGCSVRELNQTNLHYLVDALPKEQVEQLLRQSCHEGNVLVVHTLLKKGLSVCILHAWEQEQLLHDASREGDAFVVEVILDGACNINCVDLSGFTPIMDAAHEGHEEVVKMLILAGASLDLQSAVGDTALHHAAICDHIQCGILLAEAGASVRTMNEYSMTPLYLAKAKFKEAIKQALSFTTRKALCIIGNAVGGKSTLIAALQAESNSFWGKIFNRFWRVSDRRQRTAGIEVISHCSQKYGEVLFFDFAGQDDYHGPHQMFLDSLVSKPGVSMTLLLVVKVTEEEEAILHQLHRWLTPVALMSTSANPPQVIVIGSFLDKVKSKEEATAKLARCIEVARRDLEGLPLEIVGSCLLNCRQPQSEGIDQLCCFLQEIPIPEFRATHTGYSLAWVLYHIRSSITSQAVQLQEFAKWIQVNKDNLPRTMPPPEEVCQDLSAAGHALYLPNKEDPPQSWLVLDLPSILHDVYGTLFSQSKEMVNEFGLLHYRHLAELFPHLDLEMVQQLLISLEFCLPVDPSVLKVELNKLTLSEEASGWLFFPALISAKPPQPASESLPQQNVRYLFWQLRTAKKQPISACVLQTILLRLAAHFVVKQHDRDGVQQHYCSIWWNGIAWESTVGVDVTVHITNNRVIQVVSASRTSADKSCQYLTDVIDDILSTVCQLSPKLSATAYIVHPPIVAPSAEGITTPPPMELFPVEGIRNSIREDKEFIFSLKDCENHWNRMSVTGLFGGHTPSLDDIGRINWPQPEPNQPHSPTGPNPPEFHTAGSGLCTDLKMIPSGARALLVDVLSTPDIRDVDVLVVTAVAAKWQRVALRLGVESCVIEVVIKNHPNDCEGACRDMLGRWLRGERHTGEEERSWSTLLTALGRAGFEDLARRLRREHFKAK